MEHLEGVVGLDRFEAADVLAAQLARAVPGAVSVAGIADLQGAEL